MSGGCYIRNIGPIKDNKVTSFTQSDIDSVLFNITLTGGDGEVYKLDSCKPNLNYTMVTNSRFPPRSDNLLETSDLYDILLKWNKNSTSVILNIDPIYK